jgi:hypothetical protein
MTAQQVKDKVGSKLLKMAGVSGISATGGKLNVYLESDSAKVRSEVEKAVHALDRTIPINFVESGSFRAYN